MIKRMFESARIGNVYLKNRIVWAPLGDFMQDATLAASEQQVQYFAARAKGGAALLCQNSYTSDFQDHAFTKLDSLAKLPRFSYLTQAVHANGAKIAMMLSCGRGGHYIEKSGDPPLAPSALPTMTNPSVNSIEMTTDQVYQLIEMFKRSAALVKRADYDIIMIQGYGGYLIDEFMTEKWNKRTDEFGGSLEKRMLFPKLLIRAIKEVNGSDYPIIFKMTPEHLLPGGREMEEGLEIAKIIEGEGVAAINIDTGSQDVWYKLIPPVWQQERMHQFEAAARIKEVVKSIPVYTMGKVGDPEAAEAVFNEGLTDFVTVGRSFVADPQWANKIADDRTEDIIPCICCMEGCTGRIDSGKTIGCAVNPKTGIEGVSSIGRAERRKKIIIVGAGPAGVQAALTAAERGHDVEVWEKRTKIGGQLLPASAPAFKKEMTRLVDYYRAQLFKNEKIKLHLNKKASVESLFEAKPDFVVLATGGIPIIPGISGVDKKNVHIATDVLQDTKKYGNKCVVVGAGYVGCETALHLDYIGKEVVLIEMKDSTLPDFPSYWGYPEMNRMMMNHLIYDESSIDVRTGTRLKMIGDGFVDVETQNGLITIECDEVVLALGYKPNFELEEELRGKVRAITVGDALKAGKVIDAVIGGHSAVVGI